MLEENRSKSLAPALDDLINDVRLARLFSKDERHCALQLWVLQVKSEGLVENRVLYGRLLPYSFSSDRWSARDDDKFYFFGTVQAQIVRLNLYVKSTSCAEILRSFCSGHNISAISEELKLSVSDTFESRFGATSLAADGLVYRPTAYLLNKDGHDRRSPSSPHGGAGAFSASITRTEKGELFRIGTNYDVPLTNFIVKQLDEDTGLDFGGADVARFGDLELMVFPALDDQERSLLKVNWVTDPVGLTARFDPMQVAHFSGFQFRLCVTGGNQTNYSSIAIAERDGEGLFTCTFELGGELRSRSDSTEIEIFGFDGAHSPQGILCCRWRIDYIREIQLNVQAIGSARSAVKFDWLEKTTRESDSARVKSALTINGDNLGTKSQVGGRGADPWVPANRELASLFARLHPPKSDARFFPRWSQGAGDGRLQFVEWFRTLLGKYEKHQIVIFDPYFEDAGLGLLLLCAASNAEYLVFTSLPKLPKTVGPAIDESSEPRSSRINNLMASCEHNRQQMQHLKLRIYGLKEGRLHDRYILIVSPDGLPTAGFNLSNSLQKAAENYPLLITPIPADTLLKVEQYKSELVQEARAADLDVETDNASMRLLCEASRPSSVARRFEPLRFLEKAEAGNVLSLWTGELSLSGLNGDPLKERMAQCGLIKENRLALDTTTGLLNCIEKQANDAVSFEAVWDVLGDVLANTRSGEQEIKELEGLSTFLEFLANFVRAAFDRPLDGGDREIAILDTRIFSEPIDVMLHRPYRLDHLFHPTKYAGLSWADFFAVKFLWSYAPAVLLQIAEERMVDVPVEPAGPEVFRLSLLSQIVSEVSQSTMFDINETQRSSLIQSRNGLLHWMGLNALEKALGQPKERAASLETIGAFAYLEQVQVLSWMISRAAKAPETAEIYTALRARLYDILPPTIPTDDLRCLVNSMRGHMQQLGWAEPWLFEEVVFPLLQNERANMDDACAIWTDELVGLVGTGKDVGSRLFERSREGRTTNISAYLFAHSTPRRQLTTIKELKAIIKRQKRVVQQPLASTSGWSQWNDGLMVSMWILAWTRWARYYLHVSGKAHSQLEELERSAEELATVRSMDEWKGMGPGRTGEMAAFLNQADELLAQIGDAKA